MSAHGGSRGSTRTREISPGRGETAMPNTRNGPCVAPLGLCGIRTTSFPTADAVGYDVPPFPGLKSIRRRKYHGRDSIQRCGRGEGVGRPRVHEELRLIRSIGALERF